MEYRVEERMEERQGGYGWSRGVEEMGREEDGEDGWSRGWRR